MGRMFRDSSKGNLAREDAIVPETGARSHGRLSGLGWGVKTDPAGLRTLGEAVWIYRATCGSV